MSLHSSDEHPYQDDDGRPRLRDSWVLYLDALGTSARAATLNNETLRRHLDPEAWYHRFLYHQNLQRRRRALYFTDNVVVGVPTDEDVGRSLRSLGELLQGAATYIVGMAIEANVAMRGAISFGPAYIDDVVFDDPLAAVRAAHGSALVEAVGLEKDARVPRVMISPSVIAEVQRLAVNDDLALALPPSSDWLTDDEGVTFLDHLGSELVFDPNPSHPGRPKRAAILSRYAKFISAGIERGEATKAKYEWLANYHDFVVQTHGVGTAMRDRNARHFFRI